MCRIAFDVQIKQDIVITYIIKQILYYIGIYFALGPFAEALVNSCFAKGPVQNKYQYNAVFVYYHTLFRRRNVTMNGQKIFIIYSSNAHINQDIYIRNDRNFCMVCLMIWQIFFSTIRVLEIPIFYFIRSKTVILTASNHTKTAEIFACENCTILNKFRSYYTDHTSLFRHVL